MIEKLSKKNEELWKNLFEKEEESRFQHSLNYKKIIEETYKNCECHYYLSLKNKKPINLFPFILLKSKIFGKRLISVPFLDVGGFLGKYNAKNLKEIIGRLKEKGNSIEIRLNSSMKDFEKYHKFFEREGFGAIGEKEQLIVNLTSEEDMWKRFHKHTRNDIRKAMKSELQVIPIDNDSELKKFYSLYIWEMKNFGTPQHSFKFFNNSFKSEKVIGFNCYKKREMIGSIVVFFNKRFGYVGFNISNVKYRNLRPNDLLYWETIRWAINNKLDKLDLGQVKKDALRGSRSQGLFKFKQKWLGEIYERVYFTFPKRENSKKKNKLKRLRRVWRKIPLPIIKIIGPKICSELGI